MNNTFKIDICDELKGVEITVKNGSAFKKAYKNGDYCFFEFTTNEADAKRIKQYAIHYADDKSSCRGNWYANCTRYSMGLLVAIAGKRFMLNTYKGYRRGREQ